MNSTGLYPTQVACNNVIFCHVFIRVGNPDTNVLRLRPYKLQKVTVVISPLRVGIIEMLIFPIIENIIKYKELFSFPKKNNGQNKNEVDV